MKSNELRIGNIVQAKSPEKKNYEPSVKIDSGWLVMYFNKQIDLKPIELTEEWLIKFGFETLKHCSVGYKIYYNGIDIAFLNDKLYCYVCDISTHHIKYVHQLQNLYFALTGGELETK